MLKKSKVLSSRSVGRRRGYASLIASTSQSSLGLPVLRSMTNLGNFRVLEGDLVEGVCWKGAKKVP